jgi:hypothetical protein
MNLTVKTIVKWNSMADMGNPNIAFTRQDKILELKDLGKTDGVVERNDTELTGTLKFIDNTSAEEWINYITSLTTEKGIQLVSTQIVPV